MLQDVSVEQRAGDLDRGKGAAADRGEFGHCVHGCRPGDSQHAHAFPLGDFAHLLPHPAYLGWGQHLGRIGRADRGPRLVDCCFQSFHRERRRVEGLSGRGRSVGDSRQQVVDVIDRRVLVDDALGLELVGQFLEIDLRAVGQIADRGQQHQRRQVQRGQGGHVDEIADRLTGHVMIDLGCRRRRFTLGHAAHVMHEKIEHLLHHHGIGAGALERLGHEQRGRFAHHAAQQARAAAQRALGKRQDISICGGVFARRLRHTLGSVKQVVRCRLTDPLAAKHRLRAAGILVASNRTDGTHWRDTMSTSQPWNSRNRARGLFAIDRDFQRHPAPDDHRVASTVAGQPPARWAIMLPSVRIWSLGSTCGSFSQTTVTTDHRGRSPTRTLTW